ncbi:MAG: hypothetical protein L0Y80_11195 [Ignavibacteriae bacterium]|nr:hypothetical protein [Ignavibacteriota bacterium]
MGIFLYSLSTRAKDQIGIYSLWSLVGFLLTVYFMNVFGPPPPNEETIAIAGNATWLVVLWGYWIDKHRKNVDPQPMDDEG